MSTIISDDKEMSCNSSSDTPCYDGVSFPTDQPGYGEKHKGTQQEASRHPEEMVDSPPNGGLKAWLQACGAFFLMMNSWGIINSFGVFQTYYATGLLNSSSASDISWIGSIQAFLLLLMGIAIGPLFDRGYMYIEIWFGSFLTVFGVMMTSLSTKYWQVMLAQGVCVGLGSGCIFVPLISILPQYFTTRKAFALGIAASGSSIGGIIYPIVFYKLQPLIGFAWATRVIGFIALATFSVPLSVMRLRILPKDKRSFLESKAFKEAPYNLVNAGLFATFLGLYIPIFYIQSYSIQQHITSENLGFYTLPMLNAASIFGRVVPNYLADRMGAFNMLIPCAFASSILCFSWIGIESVPGVIVLAILYGFFSGAFVSLPPAAIVNLSSDHRVVGTRMGMSFAIASFGVLIGTPVSGAILNSTGQFLGLKLFAACTVLLGAVLMLSARCARYGSRISIRA